MRSKIIAIHQPNLFPWLGYFAKIDRSDVFIFLDHTVNNRTEATYTRRVQLLNTQGEATFLTIPIKKINNSDFGPISEWEVNFEQPGFPKKQLESIIQTYKKHPFFTVVFPLIEVFFDESSKLSLTQRNACFIRTTCHLLGITTPFVSSSEIQPQGNSTELLISLVQSQKGTHYLSGKGGDNYQNPQLFEAAGIVLDRIGFVSPLYVQSKSNAFIAGLSIVDCLMNIGFLETANLINKLVVK